jgi:hypothetical protein
MREQVERLRTRGSRTGLTLTLGPQRPPRNGQSYRKSSTVPVLTTVRT